MESLDTLVERYGRLKGEMDSYKPQVDADNKAIKELMAKENLTEHTSGGYTAKYSVSVSKDFDEAKLIAKLKEISGDSLVIKTREYVDIEALENAIYNGRISASDLADCKVEKTTVKLLIKKVETETPKTRTRKKKSEE